MGLRRFIRRPKNARRFPPPSILPLGQRSGFQTKLRAVAGALSNPRKLAKTKFAEYNDMERGLSLMLVAGNATYWCEFDERGGGFGFVWFLPHGGSTFDDSRVRFFLSTSHFALNWV